MLRITVNASASRAKSYYSTADYYTEGQELVGRWRGEGAARLGLDGIVQNRDWDALCENRIPATGERLTPRRKQDRRVGYDINFHVPKSVSLLYNLTQDDRILDAFRESVESTMLEIEAESKARVRRSGQNEDRVTGNLVWGEFVHLTARPEDGVPDPHLHAHCFVFNGTFDTSENRWKAVQLGDIKRDAPYFEAVFHSRLARRLEELGLDTHRTSTGWELRGIDSGTLAKFSRRTARIEAEARSRGITDPDAKGALGAKTRSRKVKELGMTELRALWRSRMDEPESNALDALAQRIGSSPIDTDHVAAHAAVERAMAHGFERASVLPERMLLAEAIKQGVGVSTRETMEKLVGEQPLVRATRNGRQLVTTKEVLEEEGQMLAFAREGRGTCRPISPGPRAFRREWLNQEQQAAVRHVLESRDRVVLIRGAAGVGKTSMMQEASEAIEEVGLMVHAFAPSASASRRVLRAEGFESADTVARLLVDQNLQREVEGAVLWIDEAGLIGTKTMRAIFELADRMNARVVLSGDRRQHGAVERGAALRLLEEEAGLKPAEIKEIQRQRDQYKRAVKALSEGDVRSGFQRLDSLGWIRQSPTDDREQALAAAYLDAVRHGKTALVVSPTHAEGDRITAELRRQLRASKDLGNEARHYTQLVPAHLTLGQRMDPTSYQQGDVLVFHQNAKGVRKGQRLTVGHDPVPLDQAERFSVFHRRQIELATGDRIRITQNGVTPAGQHRLHNGDLFTVKRFASNGDMMLDNGWTLPKDYGHLTYGHVVTSHASQGRTVDRVFIGQSSASFAASSLEQFYVSVSRGREQAQVFTDCKSELLEAVSQSDERLSGTELVAGVDPVRHRLVRERLAEQVELAPATPVVMQTLGREAVPDYER
jgi:conjugative relaxase-like TrwC/TraI family protein